MIEEAPYGSWPSPITADLIVKESIFIGTHGFSSDVRIDGADVYWLEGRPNENGRGVVVCYGANDDHPGDVTPAFVAADKPYFDVRTQVYEYGGGAWLVDGGVLYFSNFSGTRNGRRYSDGRLYRQDRSGGALEPLTPELPASGTPVFHYADGLVDRIRKRWIGVVEDWSGVDDPKKSQPEHRIVAINLSGGRSGPGIPLAKGHDFFSSPRLSPDGEKLAWLAWDHPRMPWHGTTLYMVDLDSKGNPAGEPVPVAGGPEESILQPEWSPNGEDLWFVSDRSGWWNLYYYDLSTKEVQGVTRMEADFGQPQWNLAQSTYAFTMGGHVIATCTQDGLDRLVLVDPATGKISDLHLPHTRIESVRADNAGRVVFVAGSATVPMSIVVFEVASGSQRILKKETDLADDPKIKRHLTRAEQITFPTTNGEVAHALYYPPTNADFRGPADERPPLVVMCHGGPTSRAFSPLNLEIQYRTSRGIAVLDVNFRGSSGFGKAYRDRLEGSWGIVDVEDCVNGARHLAVTERLVDRDRTVITGRSGGGYTTLAALTSSKFHDSFRAGASHYGIGDLVELAKKTHKFESRYLDWLVGPPEQLRERSPRNHVEHLSRPVIFFQGEDDPIVPPDQAEAMFKAIREQGLLAGYFLFGGERHGFRRADNIRRSIEAEHYFFAFQVFRSRLSFGEPAGAPH